MYEHITCNSVSDSQWRNVAILAPATPSGFMFKFYQCCMRLKKVWNNSVVQNGHNFDQSIVKMNFLGHVQPKKMVLGVTRTLFTWTLKV
jgi:hypothetical protein